QATAALEEARRRRILWIDELQSRCSFTHDKLREILLDRLDAHERMALHKEAAELIESSDPTRIFELAYHFDQAGEGGRALPYALMAAEEARGRHALDIAATHYRIAERAVNEERVSADDALLVQIAEGFGDVLTLQGHYEEASGYLSEALARTGDGFGRASIDLKLGNIAFKRGDQAQAREYLEEALGELGRRVPRHWLVRIGALVGQTAVQALHTLLPRVFVGRRDAQGHAEEFLAIRIYSRLAYVNWFSTGKTACAWAHLKEMNLAERYGSTPELAQAYSEHAPVMTMLPWFGRGLKYARQSMEIRRDLGDAWGVGQSLNFCGVVLYASTRYREGIESFREAIRLLERTGDRWEMNTAIWNQIFCHYRLGELETAAHMARDLYHSATEIGDVTAAGVSLSGWARADPSTVPEAALAIEMDRDLGDAHTGTEVHLADGIRLLGAGQFSAAAGRIRRASEIAAAAGLRQEYVAPVKPWLATALRMQAESADAHDPKARARLVRQADRAAARAARHARWFRNNRPHALRELALTASLRGRAGRARRHIRSSIEMAEEQSAAYELALSRGVAARLAVARGDQTAASALADAEVERMRLEPRPPLPAHTSVSLADQYEKLLEIGRRIGTASSPAAIYQQVHDAALQLLRGDRCEVVRLARDAGPSEVGGSIDVGPDVMSELIRRALAHRKPVVSDENVHLDSPTFAESRSILCAPITCGDEVVACVVVTHRQVNDLFGDVEVQLMEFVSTLAGAALDHVAGSEARFRSLAQNSSDVITIVDKSGLITYQSAAVEQVFGFRPEDMVGSELAAWIHPDDRDALLVHLDAAASSGTVGSVVQARMRHSDGSWRVGESAVHNLFLDPSVEGLVLNTRDASERVALENELRIRATHDALTGLANRALFVERVDEAFRRTRQKRSATPQEGVAVIFLDLDDFKAINDSLGHFVGDRLLEMTARRLEECVRPGDTVARWGGDEFALLLEWCDSATAESIVMRIITELGRPYRILNQEVLSRASAGVSLSYGQEAASELLVGADLAMYEGKSRGKSRYQFFEPAMRAAAIERSHIRTDLEWVIQRNELSIHYQPIIDLSTGQLKGLEALVRWNHPTRGLMLPESWIGTAEESGMIVPIGSWVIDRACRQLAAWQEAFGEELSVAVNVSARQLQGPALVEEIARILGECGLHPSSLVLEITESATVVDAEAVLGRLRALKSLGVELSIDDFGTGYSSLSYLQRFPVDYLKIDRSFVAEMISSPEDAAIVSWVVNLAHSLRLKVVAEGVESLEQMEALSHIGCDQAQGFVWSKPRPAEDVGKWFDSEWDLA
ncbi:MAG TPA: EAL domain-containing protein, partial [Acidimicrobiales bacterium]|nr:EAL domain-containing protein [Acidimicrobiales bacterium]